MNKVNSNIFTVTLVALSVAVLTVCSWISIPSIGSMVPFTMQTFAVFVICGIFDWKRSLMAISVYILLGAVGVPVFTGFRGGLAALTGPTGGYIVGFVFCAVIIQIFKSIKKNSYFFMITGMLAGLTACYAFGTAWYLFIYINSGEAVTPVGVLSLCVFPYVIPDLLKMSLAVIIVNRLNVPLKKLGIDFSSNAVRLNNCE